MRTIGKTRKGTMKPAVAHALLRRLSLHLDRSPRGPRCRACEDTGFERGSDDRGYSFVRQCRCRSTARRDPSTSEHSLAFRGWASYVPRDVGERVARSVFEGFASQYPRVRRGLLLTGPPGSGKTHLVAAMGDTLKARGLRGVLHVGWGRRYQDIRSAAPDVWRLVQPLIDAELLLLDGVGDLPLQALERDVLQAVIGARYNQERTTLLTSRSRDIVETFGTWMSSRLAQMCVHLDLHRPPTTLVAEEAPVYEEASVAHRELALVR